MDLWCAWHCSLLCKCGIIHTGGVFRPHRQYGCHFSQGILIVGWSETSAKVSIARNRMIRGNGRKSCGRLGLQDLGEKHTEVVGHKVCGSVLSPFFNKEKSLFMKPNSKTKAPSPRELEGRVYTSSEWMRKLRASRTAGQECERKLKRSKKAGVWMVISFDCR